MNSKRIAVLAAQTLSNKKATDIVCIDIETKSSIADYFILASGGSERQIKALSEEVEDQFAKEGILAKSIEGKPSSGWILMDFGDVIVSVLTVETRQRYNIEKVWADCDILDWEEAE
jgi:iojap-related protein